MTNAKKSARSWPMLLTAMVAGGLLAVFGMTAAAQAAGVPASAQQADIDGNGGDDDRFEVYGRIDAMPDTPPLGVWKIGGNDYTVVAETELKPDSSAFEVGMCVKLDLLPGTMTVREMHSESDDDDCSRGGDDDDDEDGREFYAIVNDMPDGTLYGQWTIGGNVYAVTEQTEFSYRFGPIVEGKCVEVELTPDESAVAELQSKRNSSCMGDDDDDDGVTGIGYGELYAELIDFPSDNPDLVGIWEIGTISVTATISTEFNTKNGPFVRGDFVKVEFVILQDGTFWAREIKTIDTDDDDDDGDGDYGARLYDSKAFGVIQAMSDTLPSIWNIGGISYTVTISTEIDDDRGDLTVGQNVKVEFRLDAEGNRVATEIKSMPPRAGDKEGVYKLVGYVQAKPEGDTYLGSWTIGGVVFTADERSMFEDDLSMLDVGVFVEVKYFIEGDVRRIFKLEAHVLPGGGDDDYVGQVQNMDDSLAAAAGVAGAWTIGGRSYVVLDATAVSSDVVVGGTAVVNSYVAADGTQVATRIDGVTLNNRLYLPTAIK